MRYLIGPLIKPVYIFQMNRIANWSPENKMKWVLKLRHACLEVALMCEEYKNKHPEDYTSLYSQEGQ